MSVYLWGSLLGIIVLLILDKKSRKLGVSWLALGIILGVLFCWYVPPVFNPPWLEKKILESKK